MPKKRSTLRSMQGPNPSEQADLSSALKARARAEGFDPVGIARLPGSNRLQMRTRALQRWLDTGQQADMAWMAAPRRQDAARLLPGAESLLVVGLNYHVSQQTTAGCLKVGRYAWGRDYHRIVDQRLRRIGRWLCEHRPQARWRACVDSAPLLDKAWAEEAGLGWIGKHSNLINDQRGSWMVLGHLLTTEPLQADQPARSLCGRCTACMTACPTQAIHEPFVVDANRCLAYHTIENRSDELPQPIRDHLGPWVAGCDICQEVCPWNHKRLPVSTDPDLQPRPWLLNLTRDQALGWDDKTWDQNLRSSALRRIKPWMWRRNAEATRTELPPTL